MSEVAFSNLTARLVVDKPHILETCKWQLLKLLGRYTVTYTPSQDRVLPKPTKLHVKIRNTCAVALRAAYLHGPYTLYAACYPSTFNPNVKSDFGNDQGVPQFEANLKAGGAWTAQLTVPEDLRDQESEDSILSCAWTIEVSSQVLFSATATVHYEILVGRDENSVELGSNLLPGAVRAPPGEVNDHLHKSKDKPGHHTQPKGVFSKAVSLIVEDTARLWDKPYLSECDRKRARRPIRRDSIELHAKRSAVLGPSDVDVPEQSNMKSLPKQQKVHLVVITHGLHSNTGADMLYLKESIDAAAKEARSDRRKRRAALRKKASEQNVQSKVSTLGSLKNDEATSTESANGLKSGHEVRHDDSSETDDSDEEEVVVRGFSGNVIRTERGLQYLGKRLAKYVLTITYPDQPVLPTKQSVTKKMSRAFTGSGSHSSADGKPSHPHSSIRDESKHAPTLPYRITSISFIGHSLGGLTQTYAIAYIQKHSPTFFLSIRPINFIALATPFLGLNHENPMYVKFALDFGLVGKTGQDLGLAWRAPNFARSGWAALIGGTGTERQRFQKQLDPGSKPLLRLLPSGPAHQVLKMFRNRTVYANVVNDGIVPLRTSCLLFLDWRGLGRVEKARRENGLVGTMASWGWAEMTGVNSSQRSHRRDEGNDGALFSDAESESERTTGNKNRETVPQPAENATADDTTANGGAQGQAEPSNGQFLTAQGKAFQDEEFDAKNKAKALSNPTSHGPLSSFLAFLMPHGPGQSHHDQPKHTRIYKRGQTIGHDQNENEQDEGQTHAQSGDPDLPKAAVSRGDTLEKNSSNVFAPPKTTVFESAGDILNPPLPPIDYLMDPAIRPRTIFHDRIYHPEDIPPPPTKHRSTLLRSLSGDLKSPSIRSSTFSGKNESMSTASTGKQAEQAGSTGGMKVEEKTARAYHKDLSWRKVLVRLEPDAHNNIIVRRMFSNAYGWPVVKHLVDTHFADTFAADTDDSEEPSEERAKPMGEAVGEHGEEVEGQDKAPSNHPQEVKWADAGDAPLKSPTDTILSSRSGRPKITREETTLTSWDDRYFEGSSDEDDSDIDTSQNEYNSSHSTHRASKSPETPKGTEDAEIADFLSASPQKEDSDKELSMNGDGKSVDNSSHTLGLPSALSLSSTQNDSASIGLHASTRGSPTSDKTTKQ